MLLFAPCGQRLGCVGWGIGRGGKVDGIATAVKARSIVQLKAFDALL